MRLIDAELALKLLLQELQYKPETFRDNGLNQYDVASVINSIPEAVVRCKDCMHRPDTAWFGCPMASSSKWQLDGFCSNGEKG